MWQPSFKFYLPGGLGDNIMQLPFALSCAGVTDRDGIYPALDLYLDLERQHHTKGCLASQAVAEKAVGWQVDLLKMQPYVNDVFYQPFFDKDFIETEEIIDTDYQRQSPAIDMSRGDIMWRNNCLHRCLKYWCADNAWLFLPDDKKYLKFQDKIVISATPRYFNRFVKWKCLNEFAENCIFIGTFADCEGFYWRHKICIDFYPVESFVEMAQIIRHCAFFIGTQSFPACLAEALKTNRIIIQAPHLPDVIPHGGCGNAVIDEADFSATLKLYVDAFLN